MTQLFLTDLEWFSGIRKLIHQIKKLNQNQARRAPGYLPIDLQFFAAEDEGRTEDPTEFKMRKAREEGRVAKSVELVSAVNMILTVLTIFVLSGYLLNTLIDMLNYYFQRAAAFDVAEMGLLFYQFLIFFIKLSLPVMAVAMVASVGGNLLQVGFLFTVKPITPDFKKIVPNFPQYLQRTFLSTEGWFNLAKSIFKIVVIAIISLININMEMDKIINLVFVPFWQSFSFFSGICLRILLESAFALLLLSIPDFFYQRWRHKESLKMSPHEIKEEMKQMEGDPHVRRRLRERMREILSGSQLRQVPEADVVITNPTHFAVVLKYEMQSMPAPMVLAKGQDEMAFRIRKVAEENNVPIMENKPLARALFAAVEVGDYVPEEYWEIVSRVLGEVYQMSGQFATAG